MSTEEYEDTIYGQVVPYSGEAEDRFDIAILVDSEEEYIVEPDSRGRSLSEYMDRWIKADVSIRETEENIYIKIMDIELDDMSWQYSEDNW
ncbi:hypothetical protein [Maridesulfovibrio sp.]|uniref:hypothetical protein n=1 Tax=Maridesulfovibrio sp. TaxID=2795000 RepID=UPI0029CA9DF8|nr:hypothetical protein [Maridesulfovibrio sp.]